MSLMTSEFRTFIAAEQGAVTVDWVVLTSALVGFGVAVVGVISVGIRDLSEETGSELSGVRIQTSFAEALGSIFGTDFADGAGEWIGGVAVNLPGFGEVLRVDGGETAELTLDVPDGASEATFSFDVIGADDLDGDPATIFVNGTEVAVYSDDHGTITTSDAGASGISVSVDQLYSNSAEGSGSHGHDSRATYTITVTDPGSSVTLGVSSGANDGVADEFYAIDDVSVDAS